MGPRLSEVWCRQGAINIGFLNGPVDGWRTHWQFPVLKVCFPVKPQLLAHASGPRAARCYRCAEKNGIIAEVGSTWRRVSFPANTSRGQIAAR